MEDDRRALSHKRRHLPSWISGKPRQSDPGAIGLFRAKRCRSVTWLTPEPSERCGINNSRLRTHWVERRHPDGASRSGDHRRGWRKKNRHVRMNIIPRLITKLEDVVAGAKPSSAVKPPEDFNTLLAIERTNLAQERTIMAWVRTATSLISFGFTIYKFFQLEVKGPVLTSQVIGPRTFAVIDDSHGFVRSGSGNAATS